MNPIKQIGRYKLQILAVVAIKQRPDGLFDAILTNGVTIDLTADEKAQYDKFLEEHELIMQVYGMCRGAGLRA